MVQSDRSDRSVEILEASSLVDASSALQRRAALQAFDTELTRLRLDTAYDAVLVVAPGPPPGPLTTTVASLRVPGLRPGLMRSAYTRRAGVVALVDVAPTILDLFDIDRPSHMEGRPFEFGRADGNLDSRIEWLANTNDRAQFRDRAITQAGGVFAACVFTLAGLAAIWLPRARGRDRGVAALEIAALALLFFLPATYLAGLMDFAHSGLRTYWWFVAGASIIPAIAVNSITDRRSITPAIVALAAVVGLIIVDVVTGARLQFNGTFGYSPTIGGRYAGLGNLGFAQLAAGAVLLAGLIAHRVGGRRGAWYASALLAVAIVVDGLPFFGADVGGVLSMVPAFGITAAMLFGWRFRWRLLALFGAAAVALVAIFAAVDLSRPADQRSHLGRLLGGNGGDLSIVLRRKLDANLDVIGATPFAFLLPIVYVALGVYVWRSPGPLGVVRGGMPAMTAALAGFGIVTVLGTVLNDSGIAITSVMFGVLIPVLVILAARRRHRSRHAATARCGVSTDVKVLLAFVVGALAVRFVVLAARDMLAAPVLQRRNYRDLVVPTAAGIFAVLAVLGVEAGRSVLGAFGLGDEPGHDLARPLVLFACVGFALLGFLDDVLGTEDDRGFRGHVRALVHGRLTTGACKIVGGAAIALVLVGTAGDLVSGKRLLADAVLVALAANLVNLLDRAPGRAIKIALCAWIPIALIARGDAVGIAIAPVMGAFAGLLGDDVRERVMLGDTGAYALGGVLGLAVVLDVGRGPRNVVLIVLVALTVAAELVSFSRVIERVPPLRAFDNLGRRQS